MQLGCANNRLIIPFSFRDRYTQDEKEVTNNENNVKKRVLILATMDQVNGSLINEIVRLVKRGRIYFTSLLLQL